MIENRHDSVYVEKKDGIATLYFNRPEKRNALTYEMWKALPDLLDEVDKDQDIKVLILRGSDEKAFAAGADINEFKTLRYSFEGAKEYNNKTLLAEEKLDNLSKPTISLIQGYCVGGGCELAVTCDFRFSDTTGKFAITPAKLGLIYNLPGTKNLVDLVGPASAKDILYSGRILNAEEASDIGLIERLYSPEKVVEETYNYAHCLANNAQISIRGAKRIIREVNKGATEESEEIANLVLSSFDSEDYKEGVQAFLEKRKPNFKYS
ncbi:enoyl-CoA hydratase-related protein [Salibacterium aidingense]|uniref:enoyl-CoA hydratase-related protein n=1 Tax=Salibacterium aidingense TaxID=384933 RepID=UPI003BDFF9AD